MLLRDQTTGRSRPAPGFPQTLPGGPTWRHFLARCAEPGEFACNVVLPDQSRTVLARALTSVDGVTLALLGGEPRVPLGEVAAACSLLIALLQAENAAMEAHGHASAAEEATRRTTELARALDAARAELASKATQLRQLNATLEQRIAEEIEERMKAEAALRQAQKMEAIGQLTGGVAHDFNNLLTIIKSSTDLLRRPGLAEERRSRYVDAIANTVDRAAKLTGQLLAFARRQALKPEVFDVPDRVGAVADMLRSIVGSRIQIVVDIACESCFAEADVAQFETALINMAVNARDAMNGEGTLTVRVAITSEMPPVRRHAGSQGRFVAVSLADTGSGIPPDKIGQIFEPFFTTKEVGKGTGLGLSQVFGFAKQSGGDVDVESEVGHGTAFTLYLRQVDGELSEEPAAPIDEGVQDTTYGRRVLVVEDNLSVGRFSTQILQDLGYKTTWATNADEALKLLEEAPRDFDIVFSDVMMPGRSGVELGQEIKRRYPGLPVVLTSGYSEVLANQGRHGFELVHKPYAVDELSRVLRRVAQAAHQRVHKRRNPHN
ncbi:response regulator [Microvirga aerilata]|uniref:histidine kinase n=2 Tax=Microvirga aerilata TaxID=670292 RepID=A0A936ZLK1_9HYPH|nr:response regulator [Microvirga aerilata]